MSSFRKDPFGHGWVLISPERGLAAAEFRGVDAGDEDLRLAAVVGGEQPGDGELASTAGEGDGSWRVRVVARPMPFVEEKPVAFTGEPPFLQGANSGRQELVIEHPDETERLETMPREHLIEVLRVYRDRLHQLSRRDDIRHVQITRSVGRAARAGLRHPYGQVLGVPVADRWLEEELAAARCHHTESGHCLFCDVLTRELQLRERVVTSNEEFAAIAPFAAKHPFETWILPRRHPESFGEMPSHLLPGLADILQAVLRGINDALNDPPYDMILHTLPTPDAAFHWHIEILPRLTDQTGFDWESGCYVNPTPPEDAARFLREALAVQQVAG